jgi:hypothetical protein
VERQLHFVQSHLTPGIANDVLNVTCIPKHSFLLSILQNSKQPEVAPTQVTQIWCMIKAYHVFVPRFVNGLLSVVAAQVVQVHSQFDRAFSLAQILRIVLQIRQRKAYGAVLGDAFIRVKNINTDQLLTPAKTIVIT